MKKNEGKTREMTKNNLKKGVKFSKDNQPKTNGRKPSRMQQFIKAFGIDNQGRKISKDDFYRLVTHLLQCNKKELEQMYQNEDLPVSITTLIIAIMQDMDDGETKTIDNILDRMYGKPTQTAELTGKDGKNLIPDRMITLKEAKRLIEDAEKD